MNIYFFCFSELISFFVIHLIHLFFWFSLVKNLETAMGVSKKTQGQSGYDYASMLTAQSLSHFNLIIIILALYIFPYTNI